MPEATGGSNMRRRAMDAMRYKGLGDLAVAFLVASLVVAAEQYGHHLRDYSKQQDWLKVIGWTFVFGVFLLTRYSIFHRDHIMLHLRGVVIRTDGPLGPEGAPGNVGLIEVLIRAVRPLGSWIAAAKVVEMTAWVVLARLATPLYVIQWGAVVIGLDGLVLLLTKVSVLKPEETLLDEDVAREVVRDFTLSLMRRIGGVLILLSVGCIWLFWLGKEGGCDSFRSATQLQLDWWGALGYAFMALIVIFMLYVHGRDVTFAYDHKLRPSPGKELPEHAQYMAGGRVFLLLVGSATTACIVAAWSSFFRIAEPTALEYLVLLGILVYRCVYFHRDYVLGWYKRSLPPVDATGRIGELVATLFCEAFWLMLCLSIAPTIVSAAVALLLLVADLVKCGFAEDILKQVKKDPADRLCSMMHQYAWVDGILIFWVIVSSVACLSPSARAWVANMLPAQRAHDAAAIVFVSATLVLGLLLFILVNLRWTSETLAAMEKESQ